jgi:type IV fimbrial biogenesis protein FimT
MDHPRDQLLGDEEGRLVLMQQRPQRGFTLVEVLISITVLGILIMMAMPSFGEWLQNQQLRAGAEASLNGLQVARAEAIRRNNQVQIVFGPGTGWTVQEVTSASPFTLGAAIQTRAQEEGSPNAVLTATPAGATTVTFTPLGAATTNGDTTARVTRLDISNPMGGACQPAGPMRCLALLVQGGGTVKMCDPIVSAPDARGC